MKDSNGRMAAAGLSRDAIKYIAVVTMLLNHIAAVFLAEGTMLYDILTCTGYYTAFAMCSFLVEGYAYTRSKRNYARRLLVFAVISELPFCLAFTKGRVFSFTGLNMIFTLFICFCVIHVLHTVPDSWKKTGVLALLVLVTVYSDWGIMAPLMTILFVKGQASQEEQKKSWKIAVLFFGILNFAERAETAGILAGLIYGIGCMIGPAMAGICILYFYNGKTAVGRNACSKWFFYLFYPAHLFLLGMIRVIM